MTLKCIPYVYFLEEAGSQSSVISHQSSVSRAKSSPEALPDVDLSLERQPPRIQVESAVRVTGVVGRISCAPRKQCLWHRKPSLSEFPKALAETLILSSTNKSFQSTDSHQLVTVDC